MSFFVHVFTSCLRNGSESWRLSWSISVTLLSISLLSCITSFQDFQAPCFLDQSVSPSRHLPGSADLRPSTFPLSPSFQSFSRTPAAPPSTRPLNPSFQAPSRTHADPSSTLPLNPSFQSPSKTPANQSSTNFSIVQVWAKPLQAIVADSRREYPSREGVQPLLRPSSPGLILSSSSSSSYSFTFVFCYSVRSSGVKNLYLTWFFSVKLLSLLSRCLKIFDSFAWRCQGFLEPLAIQIYSQQKIVSLPVGSMEYEMNNVHPVISVCLFLLVMCCVSYTL